MIFMRHGIAVDRETFLGDDKLRPLTKQGRERTRLSSSFLLEVDVPDVVISSDFKRAVQTADVVCERLENLGHGYERFSTTALAVEASVSSWLDYIRSVDDGVIANKKVLLVGHEPSLSTLFSYYLNAEPSCFRFKKAGIGVLYSEPDARWTLKYFLSPKILRNLK